LTNYPGEHVPAAARLRAGRPGRKEWGRLRQVLTMAKEIERKFLVDTAELPPLTGGVEIQQGFIPTRDLTAVRVRLAGDSAWLTLKGESTGATRSEFEYPIPVVDARQMITEFCAGKVISKTRYRLAYGEHLWEIDVFSGDNTGLVIAEVELSEEGDNPRLPPWAGVEVTEDSRYFNASLYDHPFCQWVR
jgi:adenylate cyclase